MTTALSVVGPAVGYAEDGDRQEGAPAAARLDPQQIAQAQTQLRFDIAAQPLSDALTAFGRQSGWQVSYAAGLTQGLRSQPVSGAHAPGEALGLLLAGTGIVWRLAGDRAVVLEKAQTGDGGITLSPVTVEGQGETAYGPVAGYVATRSATATKTDTPLLETPRSISVVTADEIDDQKATDIRQTLRYTPGLVAEARGTDFSQPSLIIRGFQSFDPIYRDGMKGHGRYFLTYGSTPLDPYGLERVEVLRGPASVLYGQGQVGGLVNTVSKRPTEEFFAETEGDVGNYSQFGGKFDIGGPIDDERQFLFRVTGLARTGDNQVDTLEDSRAYVAPALTWQPDADTTLTLLTNYQRDDTVGGQIVPFAALNNPVGNISTHTLLSEPGFERFDKNEGSAGYLFDRRIGDNWLLNHKLRYSRFDVDYRSIFSAGFQADNRTLNRSFFSSVEDGYYLTTDTNLQATFGGDVLAHTVLIGVDYKLASVDAVSAFGAAPPVDAFNPVYGQPITIPAPYLDQVEDAYQVGIYFQDQVKLLDRLVLDLGGRQDWASSTIDSRLTGTRIRQDDSAFTGQAGLVYLFDFGLAPYVSYATSFEPQSGTNAAGEPFTPTTGQQFEAGVKFQPAGYSSFITVAGYQLTLQDILTPDPTNPNFSVQTGEARSRGVEVEAKASLLDNLNLTAAYTYTDTEITKSNGPDLGNQLDSVPKHAASVWADYTIAAGPLEGLGFGAGVRYVGSTLDITNTVRVPSFTLVDAAIHYDWNDFRFAVNASNLFDETYLSSCFSPTFCYFGQRRVVMGSVKYRW
jgi:iron complex outermembrane receptor protein